MPMLYEFTAEPSTWEARGALRLEVPAGLQTKADLLTALSARLQFPAYCGDNWDAFEECLHDLTWLSAWPCVVLRHADVPLPPASTERRTYLEILHRRCTEQPAAPPRLAVVFPPECATEVLRETDAIAAATEWL